MRRISFTGSIALLLFACQGCLFSPAPYAPQLKGTWAGRVESVTVTDEAGKQLTVGGLRVESGPKEYAGSDISDWRPPYKSYAAQRLGPGFGDGDLPLLARPTPGSPNAIAAAELPVGKRVRIRGTMTVMPVCTPDGKRNVNRAYPPQRPIKDESNEEHVIWFEGDPQILDGGG